MPPPRVPWVVRLAVPSARDEGQIYTYRLRLENGTDAGTATYAADHAEPAAFDLLAVPYQNASTLPSAPRPARRWLRDGPQPRVQLRRTLTRRGTPSRLHAPHLRDGHGLRLQPRLRRNARAWLRSDHSA